MKNYISAPYYYCMSYTDRIIWGTGYEDIDRKDRNGETYKYKWSCQSPDGKTKPDVLTADIGGIVDAIKSLTG